MTRFFTTLNDIVVALWAGGLWIVGALVAPALFRHVPDRQIAGALAGQMFSGMAYIGAACGLYLLIFQLGRFGLGAMRRWFFWVVVLMLLVSVSGQFGVQPILASLKEQALPREVMESVFRDRFTTWHGVASSILSLIESALAILMVALAGRGQR